MKYIFRFMRPLGAVLLLAIVFICGTMVGTATPDLKAAPESQPVASPPVESRLLTQQTIEYREVPVETTKTVTVVEKQPVELQQFKSRGELESWLQENQTSQNTVYLQPAESVVDCDDYALNLQQAALKAGYIISFQVISQQEYNTAFKTDLSFGGNMHAIDSAVIGNDVYYIEPQTGEVVFAIHLD